ncbi:MAG UNVERIFIED_CONTAM: hypothetical protein LVT10_27685 [Anaerolineae bacterium]|jgi:predicted RNA methylase
MDADSLWFDEGWSAYAALEPTLWDAVQFDQTNPPFDYALKLDQPAVTRGLGIQFALFVRAVWAYWRLPSRCISPS